MKPDQIRKLKSMNKASVFDQNFISMMFDIVYGDKYMESHEDKDMDTLNKNKLNFIEGIFYYILLYFVSILIVIF